MATLSKGGQSLCPPRAEVEVVGIAPRAIRRGAFGKRALHYPPLPLQSGTKKALRQAQRTKGRNKGQGVNRLNGLAHH